MPELPEVETLRLQLAPLLSNLTIENITLLKRQSFIGDKRLILGVKITDVRRFAKILCFDFSNGLSLLIHLKMSGQLIFRKVKTQKQAENNTFLANMPNKYTRVIIGFTNGDQLYFNDQRRFGWMKLVKRATRKAQNYNLKSKIDTLEHIIDKLGPDPLSQLTAKKLEKILLSSNRPIKSLLMDQAKLGGVGNIYANEVLFLVGIHPKTPASKISKQQTWRLFLVLRKVLRQAIKLRGSSQNHYRDAFGKKGSVQKNFNVYNRKGSKCLNNCGSKIRKIKLSGRSTYYCPRCQKPA